MSSARNTRLAWIAQELANGKSNAMIVVECMAKFHGVSEKVARADLREILQRFTEIENDSIEESKAKFMEVGWKLLADARAVTQYGPAVNLFKTLAAISGLLDGNGGGETRPLGNAKTPLGSAGGAGTPEASVVRERIAELQRNKAVRESAREAGVDLAALKSQAK